MKSIERAIRDPATRILVGKYSGAWHIAFIASTDVIRGPGGGDWFLVEYRLETGFWVTAYQPDRDVQAVFSDPIRSEVQWLR